MYRRLIKNKKGVSTFGSEFILWFFRIFILLVVLIGVIMISSILFKKQVDVREVENAFLSGKIVRCISDYGKVDIEKFTEDKIRECIIFDEEEFYVKITLIYEGNTEILRIGDISLDELCELVKNPNVNVKNYPSCLEKQHNVLVKKNSEIYSGSLYIITSIKKIQQNIL